MFNLLAGYQYRSTAVITDTNLLPRTPTPLRSWRNCEDSPAPGSRTSQLGMAGPSGNPRSTCSVRDSPC